MLDKNRLMAGYFRCCNLIDLSPEDVVLGAGGACVMFGIRSETADIDVDIPADVFVNLKASGKYNVRSCMGVMVLEVAPHMEVHERISLGDVVVIDGVTCYDPVEVLRFKQHMNRSKDANDILNLKKLLETQER